MMRLDPASARKRLLWHYGNRPLSIEDQDLLTIAVDNLDVANMVVAIAAGNSGPGHYTIESPGSAARALTAGASTVGHFIGAPITVGGNTYAGAIGDFATVAADLTAPLAVPAAVDAGRVVCLHLAIHEHHRQRDQRAVLARQWPHF